MELREEGVEVSLEYRGERVSFHWSTIPPGEEHLRVELQGAKDSTFKVIETMSLNVENIMELQ